MVFIAKVAKLIIHRQYKEEVGKLFAVVVMKFINDDVVEAQHEIFKEVALVVLTVLVEEGIVVDVGIGDEDEGATVRVVFVFEVVADEVMQGPAGAVRLFDFAHGLGGDGLHFEVEVVIVDEFLDVFAVLLDEGVGGGDEEDVFAFQVVEVQQAGDGFAGAGVVGVHHQIVLAQGFICPHLVVERPAMQTEWVAISLFFGVGKKVDGDHGVNYRFWMIEP